MVALLITTAPALAAPRPIHVPAGTVGQVAFAIGRQTQVNISIPDRRLLNRPAPAIRGRMEAGDALARLARASGLRLRKVGANSYILIAAPKPLPPRKAKAALVRPAPPPRQPPASEPMPEIIVTASKRDTPLHRFAGQTSRIDGAEFASLGVPGTEAIESRSVGFSSTHLGAGRNKLFIRGIADSSFSGPTQSPVGQYFGDMRTGYSGPDPDLKLVDMQSVEILEGPQGTLYGSGALGGIILLKPRMPIFGEASGLIATGATITAHGDPGYDATGVLNLPVGERAAVRALAYHALEGGYIDNRATGEKDINDVRVVGGRGTLSVQLSPDWAVDMSGAAQQIEGDDSQYADKSGGGLSRDTLVDQPFSSDFSLATFVVRKDSGPVRFRSTTGATWQDVQENFDASLDGDAQQLQQSSRGRSVSNETRLWRPMEGGYSWLVGLTAIAHSYKVSRRLEEDGDVIDLAGTENKVRELTIYGEAGVELMPRLEAALGARYTVSNLSGSGQHLSPVALIPAGVERTEHRLLPSAALLARPTDDLSLYARYQEGFRPGGLSIAGDIVRLYDNDQLRTGEIGFRYGRRGRDAFDLQGSATLSRWNDIQADFLDPSGLPVTDNIGDGRVWTLSVNGGAQVTSDLRFEAGLAWNDGRITRAAEAFESVLAGEGGSMAIPNIARVVARAAVDWQTRLSADWTLKANAYARYVGSSRLGIGRHLGEKQGEYLDTGLVLRASDTSRAVTLTVNNLTDEVGNRFSFGAPIDNGVDQITPLRPRTIRLGLEQSF